MRLIYSSPCIFERLYVIPLEIVRDIKVIKIYVIGYLFIIYFQSYIL